MNRFSTRDSRKLVTIDMVLQGIYVIVGIMQIAFQGYDATSVVKDSVFES